MGRRALRHRGRGAALLPQERKAAQCPGGRAAGELAAGPDSAQSRAALTDAAAARRQSRREGAGKCRFAALFAELITCMILSAATRLPLNHARRAKAFRDRANSASFSGTAGDERPLGR